MVTYFYSGDEVMKLFSETETNRGKEYIPLLLQLRVIIELVT